MHPVMSRGGSLGLLPRACFNAGGLQEPFDDRNEIPQYTFPILILDQGHQYIFPPAVIADED